MGGWCVSDELGQSYFLGGISGREGYCYVFLGMRAQGLGDVVMEWGNGGVRSLADVFSAERATSHRRGRNPCFQIVTCIVARRGHAPGVSRFRWHHDRRVARINGRTRAKEERAIWGLGLIISPRSGRLSPSKVQSTWILVSSRASPTPPDGVM